MDDLQSKGVQTIGLDAVLEQTENYAKSGFRKFYKHARYVYTVKGTEGQNMAFINSTVNDYLAISEFDSKHVPEQRPTFIKSWLSNNQSRHLHIMSPQGEVQAFASIRQAETGYRVGPIYANDAHEASNLLYGLSCGLKKGTQVFIDIPEINLQHKKFISQADLAPADFDCFRMYRGVPPDLSVQNIFAISSLETG